MTAEEWISDFHAKAAHAERAALVIAFPAETRLIDSALPKAEAVSELIALLNRGGDPVGIIRYIRNESGWGAETLLVPAHAGNPIARQLLRDIVNFVMDGVERDLGVFVSRPQGALPVRRLPGPAPAGSGED